MVEENMGPKEKNIGGQMINGSEYFEQILEVSEPLGDSLLQSSS